MINKSLRMYPFISNDGVYMSIKIANVLTKQVAHISITIEGIWTNDVFMEPTDIREIFRAYPDYIKPITDAERIDALLLGVRT